MEIENIYLSDLYSMALKILEEKGFTKRQADFIIWLMEKYPNIAFVVGRPLKDVQVLQNIKEYCTEKYIKEYIGYMLGYKISKKTVISVPEDFKLNEIYELKEKLL